MRGRRGEKRENQKESMCKGTSWSVELKGIDERVHG